MNRMGNGKRSLRPIRKLARWLIAAGLCLCTWNVASSPAQAEAPIREEKKPVKQWICVVVFAGLIGAIAFKNPNRSHQG